MVFLGFLRESFFQNLNTMIDFKSRNPIQFELPNIWNFLGEMNSGSLSTLKWVATLIFAAFFYGLTLLLIRFIFPNSNQFFFVTFTFVGVLILSGISILLGKLLPEIYSSTYYFSRWLMGAAQSPLLPGFICIALFYSHEKPKANN